MTMRLVLCIAMTLALWGGYGLLVGAAFSLPHPPAWPCLGVAWGAVHCALLVHRFGLNRKLS